MLTVFIQEAVLFEMFVYIEVILFIEDIISFCVALDWRSDYLRQLKHMIIVSTKRIG